MAPIFRLEEHRSTVAVEVLAGITSFLTISYALAINPLVLQDAGMSFVGVFTASALATGLTTIFLGLFANTPFTMAPGMGVNAFFTQTMCLQFGFHWREALCICCISGALHACIIAGPRGRMFVRMCLPDNLKYAAAVGVGAFCTMGGFHYSGLLRQAESGARNIAFDIGGYADALPPLIARFSYSKFVALLGVVIMIVLLAYEKKNKVSYAAFPLGIIITTFIGIPLGVTSLSSLHAFDTDILAEYGAMAFSFFGSPGLGTLLSGPPLRPLLALFLCLFTCLADMTDSVVTITGLGNMSMNRVFSEDEVHAIHFEARGKSRIQQSLIANALGGVVGPLLGTTPTTVFIESSMAVAAHGRTGLTAVVSGALFLAVVPFVGLYYILPAEAVGAALILSGAITMTLIRRIDWDILEEAIPSGLTILLMVATNNFLAGIAIGLGTHIVMTFALGRGRELNILMVALGVLSAGAVFIMHVLTN